MKIISDFKDYYDCIMKNGVDSSIQYVRKTVTIPVKDKVPIYIYKDESIRGYRHIGRHIRPLYYRPNILGFCGNYWVMGHKAPSDYIHNNIQVIRKSYDKYFSLTCPVFYIDSDDYKSDYHTTLTENPNLHMLGFEKYKSPYQAYQEIYTYISNITRPEPIIPQIDDITMRDIKGFDKYSFKKEANK